MSSSRRSIWTNAEREQVRKAVLTRHSDVEFQLKSTKSTKALSRKSARSSRQVSFRTVFRIRSSNLGTDYYRSGVKHVRTTLYFSNWRDRCAYAGFYCLYAWDGYVYSYPWDDRPSTYAFARRPSTLLLDAAKTSPRRNPIHRKSIDACCCGSRLAFPAFPASSAGNPVATASPRATKQCPFRRDAACAAGSDPSFAPPSRRGPLDCPTPRVQSREDA